jgi:hypothetical protein
MPCRGSGPAAAEWIGDDVVVATAVVVAIVVTVLSLNLQGIPAPRVHHFLLFGLGDFRPPRLRDL